MKPKFKNQLAWEQAQLMIQPALIRVLDNLRKQIEKTAWKTQYLETDIPIPGYQLRIETGEKTWQLDIWDLCYQICFTNYHPSVEQMLKTSTSESFEVEIDTRLISAEGEIDWQLLETKTRNLINQTFNELTS